ncbi:hypothetical protein NDU88_001257 [Pleurodeles waltl]|uniref:Uncharacterized protein n=1 Tax=Pleurodeles waltl TaxID=8319 RepID=A0AAV7V991_PLEWA|nr:hypothetical protein NDU88_001257 [Pleurodeles waltl]
MSPPATARRNHTGQAHHWLLGPGPPLLLLGSASAARPVAGSWSSPPESTGPARSCRGLCRLRRCSGRSLLGRPRLSSPGSAHRLHPGPPSTPLGRRAHFSGIGRQP